MFFMNKEFVILFCFCFVGLFHLEIIENPAIFCEYKFRVKNKFLKKILKTDMQIFPYPDLQKRLDQLHFDCNVMAL